MSEDTMMRSGKDCRYSGSASSAQQNLPAATSFPTIEPVPAAVRIPGGHRSKLITKIGEKAGTAK